MSHPNKADVTKPPTHLHIPSTTCTHNYYSRCTISSPNCALHTALAHRKNVLGIVESHLPNVIGIHVRLHRSNALIT